MTTKKICKGAALEGIRVLDLSSQGPGPYCTMMLADMGADVIRVQEPEVTGRRAALVTEGIISQSDLNKIAYTTHERNKRSITVNLKQNHAREAFYRLVKTADVLVESYRPRVTRRLKIDYKSLNKINKLLIYCSISSYGQDGPYANLVGHDINCISFAGALGLIGHKGGSPVIPLNLVADYGAGGMQSAFGILAALLARGKTGRGQHLDISLTDCVFSLLSQEVANYSETGTVPHRGESIFNGGVPYYNIYQTKDDKYLSIGCFEPWFYANLCRALGREDVISYQNLGEGKRTEIFQIFQEIFKTRTRDEWFDLLRDKDVCVAKVYDFEEVFLDPQLRHRQMIVDVEYPDGLKKKQAGISVKLSETPGRISRPIAIRGEHTRAILEELGYTKEEIERMKSLGAI